MARMKTDNETIEKLDAFDDGTRRAALRALARDASFASAGTNVNMHCHSFYSYNADGWSPSHIALEARQQSLYAVGLCDFDVLDGLDEFLTAGALLGIRATVNLETRAYVRALADVDISSPGEPGVSYVMGAGFVRLPGKDTAQAEGLDLYRRNARARNEALLARINPQVPDIALDYERDVLPLTPAGVATERHIVRAYVGRAAAAFETETALAEFWARLLKTDYESALELQAGRAALEDKVRSRFAKRGGLGYEQPSEDTFPPIEEFMTWVASCGAVPMATWLDGTSGGERDPEALLGCMRTAGAAALNIIPDRNWNIADAETRATKIANLNAVIAVANRLDMPINIGTERNKAGLPFYDDLATDALRPHRETFLRGARIMVGQTYLLRFADMSYVGERALSEWPAAKDRNDVFDRVGAISPPNEDSAADLVQMGPEKAFDWLMDHTETN